MWLFFLNSSRPYTHPYVLCFGACHTLVHLRPEVTKLAVGVCVEGMLVSCWGCWGFLAGSVSVGCDWWECWVLLQRWRSGEHPLQLCYCWDEQERAYKPRKRQSLFTSPLSILLEQWTRIVALVLLCHALKTTSEHDILEGYGTATLPSIPRGRSSAPGTTVLDGCWWLGKVVWKEEKLDRIKNLPVFS